MQIVGAGKADSWTKTTTTALMMIMKPTMPIMMRTHQDAGTRCSFRYSHICIIMPTRCQCTGFGLGSMCVVLWVIGLALAYLLEISFMGEWVLCLAITGLSAHTNQSGSRNIYRDEHTFTARCWLYAKMIFKWEPSVRFYFIPPVCATWERFPQNSGSCSKKHTHKQHTRRAIIKA